MEGILRKPTDRDKEYMDIDLNKPKRDKTARELFEIELQKYETEATKKGLPFARHVARDDFQEQIDSQVKQQVREHGEVINPIEKPKLDWTKYSDLKNFEVVKEGERDDSSLSNKHNGLSISLKWTQYRFKGYGQTYRVMEKPADAILRAQKRARGEKS